jgi:hypothetical protein
MDSLTPIWPASRTQIDGYPIGDAWPCSVMPSHPTHPWENIVPFHKLTQWLTYSLMVPMTKLLHVHFAGAELLTGLPEYRNGGLFIDTGLLTLKPEDQKRGLAQYERNAQLTGQPSMEVVPMFTADDDVIVEWRAVTVGLLDELLTDVNKLLGLSGSDKLNLAQMLEAGSWKVSRTTCQNYWRMQLTKFKGRSGNRRSVTAQYEGAPNHDLVGWNCFLRYPELPLQAYPSLHFVSDMGSGSTLPIYWRWSSCTRTTTDDLTFPSWVGGTSSRRTILTVDAWWNTSCSYYPSACLLFAHSGCFHCLCPQRFFALSTAPTAVPFVLVLLRRVLGTKRGYGDIRGAKGSPLNSLQKFNNYMSKLHFAQPNNTYHSDYHSEKHNTRSLALVQV